MERAIGSKINLKRIENNTLANEYMSYVSDILESPEIQKLSECRQHCHTSRLQHCLNVSYYAFLICKRFGWDCRSAARAGLMHDFYFYNWKTDNVDMKNHSALHPQIALENAEKYFELNDVERDAILKHMWPCTHPAPKYKESYAVTFSDKFCAILEMTGNKLIQVENNGKIVKIKKMNGLLTTYENLHQCRY